MRKNFEKRFLPQTRADFYSLIEWRRWPEGEIPIGSTGGREGTSGNLRTSGETDFEATEITCSRSRGILSLYIYLYIYISIHPSVLAVFASLLSYFELFWISRLVTRLSGTVSGFQHYGKSRLVAIQHWELRVV